MNIKNLFFFCMILFSLASCSKLESSDEQNIEQSTTRKAKTLIISSGTPQKQAVQQFGAFISDGTPNLSYYHFEKNNSGDMIIMEMESNYLGVINPTTGGQVTEESVLYEGDDFIKALVIASVGGDCPPYDYWQDGNGTYWVTDCC